MRHWDQYKMRLRRRSFLLRALRKRRELTPVANRTDKIKPSDILSFTTLRNERTRLPFFLDYYRKKGINQFLMVDNASDDGSLEYLKEQPDVSLWSTAASYKQSRFGVDWLNWLQFRYGHKHWTLVVDVDEFFVYPFCDTRPIRGLTDWLDSCGIPSFSAMLIDMYPKGPIDAQPYTEGQDPMEIAAWFDSGNYIISRNWEYQNLWIQGGPRARMFFAQDPQSAPSLNKIPLVKWHRSFAYVSSTHMLLPRKLNRVYDEKGGEKASGALLHAKFLSTFVDKAAEEQDRQQHYNASREYRAYHEQIHQQPDMWDKWSERYINWRQLEILGMMSKGNWA